MHLSENYVHLHGFNLSNPNVLNRRVYITHINFVICLSVIGDGARGDVHLPRTGKFLVCCSST